MYPHIILNLNVLGHASDQYRQILEDRIKIKHTNPDLAGAYKIILNSVYGNLRSEYSILYNPAAAKSVCFYGQAALWELCNKLKDYVQLVNVNTDGIGFIINKGVDPAILEDIKEQWEHELNLNLEVSKFTKFIQRDVNNYIGIKPDGHLKVKGGDVARYYGDEHFRNNSTRIVDIAIVDKLVKGIDPITTIMDHLDEPHLFQYVLQAGHTYKGTFDNNDKKYQHINRVFAVKNDGVQLFKKRQDDGLVRFPDTPDQMLVWNDDCEKFDDFADRVDLSWYYKLIKKKLASWEAA